MSRKRIKTTNRQINKVRQYAEQGLNHTEISLLTKVSKPKVKSILTQPVESPAVEVAGYRPHKGSMAERILRMSSGEEFLVPFSAKQKVTAALASIKKAKVPSFKADTSSVMVMESKGDTMTGSRHVMVSRR